MSATTELLSPEKHRQILRGAAEAFARDGYEGASMSRIAQCAGVSKGTLYNYFPSKADMFSAWVGAECTQNLTRVFDTTDPDGDPAAGLRLIGERMLRMMISDTGLTMYRLVVSEAAKFPDLAQAFYQSGPARAKAFMAEWLARQAGKGTLRIADPVFAAEQFFTLCQTRVALEYRLGLTAAPDEAAIRQVVDKAVVMFLNTYGAAA